LSAHVLVASDSDCHAVRDELNRLLAEGHNIEHTTLQVDHARPEPVGAHCDHPHGPTHRADHR
jgi:cobalt-zinc-cadmium efflux system protein